MKKAFMLVAAVAFLAAPVFAEVEVAITGEATTTFGFDLDSSAYGLNSAVSSDITLTVGAMDGESMGEGNWYGVIELTGAALKWDSDGGDKLDIMVDYSGDDDDAQLVLTDVDGDGDDEDLYVETQYAITAPTVAAKITNGNVYVKLQSEAGLDADFVAEVEEDDVMDYDVDYGETGSLTIGGTFGMISAAFEVATAGDYDTDEQGIALEADLKAEFAPVTVEFDWVGGFGDDMSNDMALGAQVTADVAPVKAVFAFDYQMPDGGDGVYEMGADIDVDLDPITAGLNWYFAEDNMDLGVTVGYAADALTADAGLYLYNVVAPSGVDMAWEVTLDVTYEVNSGVKLAAGTSLEDAGALIIGAYADATFTELVDNVEFKLGWRDAEDLTAEGDDEKNELGEIFASAKISY